MTDTVRDLIEDCRERGLRNLADTMDLLWENPQMFEITDEHPLSGIPALHFRVGVILGIEYENRGTKLERPEARMAVVEALKDRGQRELADSFEYCWYNADELEKPDFAAEQIPLEQPLVTYFVVGISFGIVFERRFPQNEGY